jgi:hypothetical protein
MADEMIQAIHPGCIRIIVQLGERQGGGDFMVTALPRWIESLEASAEEPMVRGTAEGAELAREMTFNAARMKEWDVACISALWIVLYNPDPAKMTLADLMDLTDRGVVTITVTADGSTWHCQVSEYRNDAGATIH